MGTLSRVVEGSIFLILIYLIGSNSYGFARLAQVGGDAATGYVKALQGR